MGTPNADREPAPPTESLNRSGFPRTFDFRPPTPDEPNASRRRLTLKGGLAALVAAASIAVIVFYSVVGNGPRRAVVVGATSNMTASSIVATTPSTEGAAFQSARDIMATSLASADAAGSVHVDVYGESGGRLITGHADVSQSASSETISSGVDHAQFVLLDGTMYFDANYGFITNAMGLSPSVATKYENAWVSIPESGSTNAGLSWQGIRNDLLGLDQVTTYTGTAPSPGQTALSGLLPSTAGDIGDIPGTPAILDISKTAPYYPTQISFNVNGGTARFRFANWGEKVSVTVPSVKYSVQPNS